jgi:exoribonuclease-2
VVMKDGLVRADTLPLVFKALGCEALARGTHVRVRITGTDALTLDVHANLVARLDEAAAEPTSGDDDEEAAAAAPLTLAIDVDEGEPAAPAAAGSEVP